MKTVSVYLAAGAFALACTLILTTSGCLQAENAALAAPGTPIGTEDVPAVNNIAEDVMIRHWTLLGPFPYDSKAESGVVGVDRAGHAIDYLQEIGGEESARITPETTVKAPLRIKGGGISTAEEDLATLEAMSLDSADDGAAMISDVFGELEYAVAYLGATVLSPKNVVAHCFFTSDDSAKVWVNGELVHEIYAVGGRGMRPRSDHFSARLNEGANNILVKVENYAGGWGAMLEVIDPDQLRDVLAPQATASPTASAEPADPDEQNWTITTRLSLNFEALVYPDVVAEAAVLDVEGEIVETIASSVGAFESLVVEPGVYRIDMTVPDLEGRELEAWTGVLAVDDPIVYSNELIERANHQAIADLDGPYAGFLLYRMERIKETLETAPLDLDGLASQAWNLEHWLYRFETEENPLSEERGILEWAYRAASDGSGQPFTIRIPDNYDSSEAYPLVVDLHGMGGSHGTTWGQPWPEDQFQLNVNGRGVAGSYIGLSGADVLDAMAYVMEHWSIDEDAVHLTGGSMGGYGTFLIGSQYPDRFATAVPFCGGGWHLVVENLIHVPVFALHSDDDAAVNVAAARTALKRLESFGGQTIMAETTGLGHGIWQWSEGREEMQHWRANMERVDSDDANRVIYEALSGTATGAYWVNVLEWGGTYAPARIQAVAGEGNKLYLTLQNVATAEIALEDSPLDVEENLTVVINRRFRTTLEAPLPETLYATGKDYEWTLSVEAPELPDFRLNQPGGPLLLYNGEPLMIVYGTQGTPEENEKLQTLAELASHTSRPWWTKINRWQWMAYGAIPVKADTDVTAADMEANHLIVIGTASQNTLAEQVAGQLPVRIEDGKAVASDNISWDLAGRGLCLTHYNPLAPQKLLYWFASENMDFYNPDTPVQQWLKWNYAPNLEIMQSDKMTIVAARAMNSRWEWIPGYDESPALPESVETPQAQVEFLTQAVKKETGADFALVEWNADTRGPFFVPGVTRKADIVNAFHSARIGVMEVSGEDLLSVHNAFSEENDTVVRQILPAPEAVDPKAQYRVCMVVWALENWFNVTGASPMSYRIAEGYMSEMFEAWHMPVEEDATTE